jgi:uncharacterized damage-inducible protein DinB
LADTDEHGRPQPPPEGDEVATLLGFLDFQRATFEWKCRGLSDAELRVALPPTSMTLGGMLKHLAYVEDYWFSEVVGGEATAQPWADADLDGDPDWDWTSAHRDTGVELRDLWMERVERSRAVVTARLASGAAEALAETHPAWDGQGRVSLRWVLVHMVEEYARHNGHGDLIRESIDGAVGE